VRRPLIVGNWKMHKTASEAATLVRELLTQFVTPPAAEVAVAPPFTALESVRAALGPAPWLALGAQNLHWEPQGAFTGEISGAMLRDLGCRYVITGHSERRKLFGERDADVRKKVQAAFAAGLHPILCVGESLEERDAGKTNAVVTDQLTGGLDGRTAQELSGLTIAYEPVWAIGTGRAATTEQAADVHRAIRAWLTNRFGRNLALTTRILYGGSVTPQNAGALLAEPDIDGALVGGACLTADSFAMIVAASKPRH